MSGLLEDVDALYCGVVEEPDTWNDQRLGDWIDSVALGYTIDKAIARALRRVLTTAGKLRAFWLAAPDRPDLDWVSKVDLALGPRAWRPVLDLARQVLASDPDPESFERVAELFRVVHNEPFLGGISFETWSRENPTR